MSLGFLPGQPNGTPNSCSFVNWNTIQILAYTSGNNIVILTKNSTHLQTIYLPEDSYVIDINKINGKIAVAIKNQVYVYTPEISNYYNFIFHGRKNLDELKIEWILEHIITNENDKSDINCLSWSDYSEVSDMELDSEFLDLPPEFNSKTLCELVTGSNNSLTMHQLSYQNENTTKVMKCNLVWYKNQPNPIYKVKFSPNATCIASIGKYDKNVKLWHRVGFTSAFCDFELHYLLHDFYVTDIIWKNHLNNANSNESLSISATSSTSNLLKPANSIIKNDQHVLSDNSSIFPSLSVENQHNVLYTITSNSLLRVYSTYKLDKGFEIYNSGSLDLFASESYKRDQGIIKSVAFIDNPYLEMGLQKALTDLATENNSVKLDDSTRQENKLLDYVKSKCELCMIIGSDGKVKLYGFGNLCNPLPTNMTIFQIDKIKQNGQTYNADISLGKYSLPSMSNAIILKSIQIDHYSDNLALTLVIHDTFKNNIREVGFTFDELVQFEKSRLLKDETKKYPIKSRLIGSLQEKFTGHNKSVRKLIRSSDGSSLLSVTRFNENYLWSLIYLNDGRPTLTKKSIIITPTPVIDAVISKSGAYVFAFVHNKLIAYDCIHSDNSSGSYSNEIASLDVKYEESPICVFLLPEASKTTFHIIAIFKNGVCKAYEFKIVNNNNNNKINYSLSDCLIENFIAQMDDVHIISAINPVGWKKYIDKPGRDVLATVSSSGLVRIYYISYDEKDDKNHKLTWHLKDSFRTGIKNVSFVSGSSINKMAIVDETKSKLSIWDMKVGVMDYNEEFNGEIVKDLDWTSTVYGQGILAVGFKSHSLLYTQLRYDYTNINLSFAKIKKIDISDQTTHEIGDSVWMKDGLLVLGAGNQFYLSDKKLDDKDIITSKAIGTLEIVSNDIFHLCSALNGPLPLYHPQFIIQLLFSGRHDLIKEILSKLCLALREIDLGKRKDNNFDLEISISKIMSLEEGSGTDKTKTYNNLNESDLAERIEFAEQDYDILIEKLQKLRLPFLSGHQQITLSHTVTIMKDVLFKYIKVLDFNGLKFYLTMKLFMVNMGKEIGKNANNSIRMRDMTFALHSDNKDLLYDIVNEQAGNKIDWLNAKRYLLPFWLESIKLKEVLERIAANEFIKFQNENHGKKDPSSCSIFYLTLKKKHVLLGLWKNSIGNSERDKMVKFLSHDFTEKRWKSAALKNAFVLLGKHRYADAATFFLLADSPVDAVNVIMKQMNDIPLAVTVARCYEGIDNGPSMKSIIERKILSDAVKDNDRWQLSWVFWILGDKSHAAQSLIKPLIHVKDDITKLLHNFKWPSIDSIVRTGNTEDPVLLVMYDSLRNRNIAYYMGIASINPQHEFSFVIKAATMYSMMGCDWLALYLVRKWKFSTPDSPDVTTTAPVVEEMPQRKRPGDILAKFMSEKPPTSNSSTSVPSLLDSFNNSSSNGKFNNLLDLYNTQPPQKSVLESYSTQPTKSLLDSYSGPQTQHNVFDSYDSQPPQKGSVNTKVSNLLDSFAMETPVSQIKKNSLLDDYMDKEKSPDLKQKSPGKKKTAPPANMLDAWA
ncbi:regulator of (H+)-ATPase in vacuolar membrane [Pichia californica]|uniref:Regulator of (H+)-ATPase in vacuolar membrane n=1 Tax=Pichia californica TaxID=460514 RepID=A0A9P6WRF0_9ASCO|nr:regulator of (H+)-ATPase in vacuolar membrane [[Candida] californica]